MKNTRFTQKWTIVLLGCFIICIGFISTIAGINNLLVFGVDCQIEGAAWLIAGESPYAMFVEDRSNFRHFRIPTHLPQSYYFLIPFALFGDYVGYLLYGITGILVLLSTTWLKEKRGIYVFLLFALLATTPFRNNLGNGQFLFFAFGLFILFDAVISHSQNHLLNYLVAPILLLFLAAKPSAFFWIPFYYPFRRKFILVYAITAILQIVVILIFLLHTGTSLSGFLQNYVQILSMYTELTGSVRSVFSISFNSALSVVNSLLVILCLTVIIFILLKKLNKPKAIENSSWLFTCIVFSFILVYHRNYDAFLLLLPLFVSQKRPIKKQNPFLFGLLAFMILQKIVFLLIPEIENALLVTNLITLVITLLVLITHARRALFTINQHQTGKTVPSPQNKRNH